jgi:hypothetical protein
VKIDCALATAARARIRGRISSDAATQSDSIGVISLCEQRDVRGRFVRGHGCGVTFSGKPLHRFALIWRRHGKQALRQLRQEEPHSICGS